MIVFCIYYFITGQLRNRQVLRVLPDLFRMNRNLSFIFDSEVRLSVGRNLNVSQIVPPPFITVKK